MKGLAGVRWRSSEEIPWHLSEGGTGGLLKAPPAGTPVSRRVLLIGLCDGILQDDTVVKVCVPSGYESRLTSAPGSSRSRISGVGRPLGNILQDSLCLWIVRSEGRVLCLRSDGGKGVEVDVDRWHLLVVAVVGRSRLWRCVEAELDRGRWRLHLLQTPALGVPRGL